MKKAILGSKVGMTQMFREDGTMTFEIDEAMSWIGQPPVKEEEILEHRSSCGIHGCK